MKKTPVTFLSIGDILIDAFIELDPKYAHEEQEPTEKELCMTFGAKIPYRDVDVITAVGNGPNAAVAAARLGAVSGSMCHVGNDDWGKSCIAELQKNNVVTDYVTTEDGQQTNYHYVLRLGAERTILIKHANFNYNLTQQLGDSDAPQWVYFTSVAENSIPYHHDIAEWIKKNNIKLAFQPGTFQIKLGSTELKDLYENTEIFFCNVEESQKILNTTEKEVTTLLKEMRKLGPKIICITDGPNGAYAYDGTEGWYIPMYPDPKPPVDRTGAGDAFSSTFTCAIMLGKTISEALQWGPINSMSVVQYIGAQAGLLTREQLEKYLTEAPAEYVVKKII